MRYNSCCERAVLNHISAPVEIEFPTEEEANKAVLEAVTSTLDFLWSKSSTDNVKEQELIHNILLLKRQRLTKEEIVERLSLHFFWGVNSQKV